MPELKVGVLGATSFVGNCLLPILVQQGYGVIAFSRQSNFSNHEGAVVWRKLPESPPLQSHADCDIPYWICAAPIWVLPEYFSLLESCGVRKVVALSSTSRFTKGQSSDRDEQHIACRLTDAESRVESWARSIGIDWVILRPTLIYGLGLDRNVAEIARFISRFGFFPVFGKAHGLRQPIHAEDVATACVSSLQAPQAANHAYNISGAETLSYREMVVRIFSALGRPPRLLTVPLWAFRIAVALMNFLPRYRHWSVAMAERMNRDMAFDHTDAKLAFGFKPRGFTLSREDMP